jgi:hypothetical protein
MHLGLLDRILVPKSPVLGVTLQARVRDYPHLHRVRERGESGSILYNSYHC